MPPDQKLCRAIRTESGRFLFPEYRMTGKVEPLIIAQFVRAFDVIASHNQFSEVMGEGSLTQRNTVLTPQIESFCEFVSDGRDS
jgi:hypothetical protein